MPGDLGKPLNFFLQDPHVPLAGPILVTQSHGFLEVWGQEPTEYVLIEG